MAIKEHDPQFKERVARSKYPPKSCPACGVGFYSRNPQAQFCSATCMGANKTLRLTGQQFGRLTVLSFAGKASNNHSRWLCLCTCGNQTIVVDSNLRTGNVKSCGCIPHERFLKHGMHGRPEYWIWISAKQRCVNPKNKAFQNYGGRGISMCKEWSESFEVFLSDMGPRPSPELTLERKDNDGNYEPTNCCWATRLAQGNNRRKRKPRSVSQGRETLPEL